MANRNPVLCISKDLADEISDGRRWRLVDWKLVPVRMSQAEELELVELTTRDPADRLRGAMRSAIDALESCADNPIDAEIDEVLAIMRSALEVSNG